MKAQVQIEKLIFGGRLLLLPMYLGIIVALVVYVLRYIKETMEMAVHALSASDDQILIGALHLLDIIMIGHLLVMAMIGGYIMFISGDPDEGDTSPSGFSFFALPRVKWLNHIDPGSLKVKLSMAILGVSSIHLLEAFVNAHNESWEYLIKLIVIHLIFVVSSIAVAWVNRHAFHNQH